MHWRGSYQVDRERDEPWIMLDGEGWDGDEDTVQGFPLIIEGFESAPGEDIWDTNVGTIIDVDGEYVDLEEDPYTAIRVDNLVYTDEWSPFIWSVGR